MRAQRPVLALIVVTFAALLVGGPASAASPQTIYKDLADNGRLDRKYSRADIARAFNLDRVVMTDPPASGAPAARLPRGQSAGDVASAESSRKVPFTGLDVALLFVGGGPLLLIGMGLRRRLATAPGRAGVA